MLQLLAKPWLIQEAHQSLQAALIASRSYWRPQALGSLESAGPLQAPLKAGFKIGNLDAASGLKSGANSTPLFSGGGGRWLHMQAKASQFNQSVAKLGASRSFADKLRSFLAQPVSHAQFWQHLVAAPRLSSLLENLNTKLALKAAPSGSLTTTKVQTFHAGVSAEAWHRLRALGNSVVRADGLQRSLQKFRQQLPILRYVQPASDLPAYSMG